jgi:D-alanyl-D-alanine carboxypeptidase
MIRLSRQAAVTALILSAVGLSVSTTHATPYLVMDIDTGRVIASEQATDPWFPASVTKLMTAYVALKEVQDGRIALDTPLIVSRRASSTAPSKMGLRPGTQVTLDNALKMIMVKSANDMAVTIAEGVGGSVEAFAGMMNREAARLGMRESHFVNPHGLPDAKQKSSARDLAVLGSALLRDFPSQQDLWSIGAIQLGQRVMPNTNGLIGRYYGAAGMKTGFICSSGFNVVATATRNNRRLLVVVLGSSSATERTLKAAELLDQGFASSGYTGSTLADLPQGYGFPPDMRGEICSGKRRNVALADVDEFSPVGSGSVGGNTENAALEMLIPQTNVASFGAFTTPRPRLAQRHIGTPIQVYTGAAPGVMLAARGSKDAIETAGNVEKPSKKSKKQLASRKVRDVAKPKGVASIISGDDTKPVTKIIDNSSQNTKASSKPDRVKQDLKKAVAVKKDIKKAKPDIKTTGSTIKPVASKPSPIKPKPLDD